MRERGKLIVFICNVERETPIYSAKYRRPLACGDFGERIIFRNAWSSLSYRGNKERW